MKPHYNTSQKKLYLALIIVWNNFLEYWESFSNYKEYYTEAFAETAKTAVQAAEDMPDHDVNTGESEEIRIELVGLADTICHDFKKTQGYINKVYQDKDERAKNYKQAGEEYYHNASRKEWESAEELGNINKTYVTDNAIALAANDNMPSAFPTTVAANYTAFKSKLQVYMSSKNMTVETSDKVKANNDCYDLARDMMDDAVAVFWNDETKANKFIWERILQSVGVRQAGLEGYVKDKATKMMLEGVVVELQLEGEPKFEVVTNAKGKFSARGITAGKYTYAVKFVGKKTITGEKEVKTSTVSRMKFEMEDL
ncbi:MAG: carboxypeptidase regulatory-like domain-containing protein [Bacteroidota bacterium]